MRKKHWKPRSWYVAFEWRSSLIDVILQGNISFKRKDFEKAVEYYSQSIGLDGGNAVYYLNRAMALLKLNRYAFLTGRSLFMVVRYAEVEQDCSRALSLDAKSIKAFWRRSTARKHLGKLTEAAAGRISEKMLGV